jgi:hypothetical protein
MFPLLTLAIAALRVIHFLQFINSSRSGKFTLDWLLLAGIKEGIGSGQKTIAIQPLQGTCNGYIERTPNKWAIVFLYSGIIQHHIVGRLLPKLRAVLLLRRLRLPANGSTHT